MKKTKAYICEPSTWQVLLDGEGQSYTNTLKQYKAKADYFTCAYLGKNNGYNVPMTPGQFSMLFLLLRFKV